jgi:hypothetical protein
MSNILDVNRTDPQPSGVRGTVLLQGREIAKSIEPTWRPEGEYVQGKTAIPADTYPLGFRWSPSMSHEYYTLDGVNLVAATTYRSWSEQQQQAWLAKYRPASPAAWAKLTEAQKLRQLEHLMIHVQGIARESNVYFHWGNWANQSKACAIIGAAWTIMNGLPAVNNSRACYVKFYARVAPLVRAGGATVTYHDLFAAAGHEA